MSAVTADRSASADPAPPQHPDVALWRAATSDDIDALTGLVHAAGLVDHPTFVTPREEVAEPFESSWIDPTRDTVLGLDADGGVLAFGAAIVHPAREAELHAYLQGVVHPGMRRRGIGRELMRWEHERALQALGEVGSEHPAAVFVYAEEGDTGARRLAEDRGLREERWFATMVRDLSQAVPDVSPTGEQVRIVAYDPSLKEAVRVARNDSFRDHWGSLQTPPERWSQYIDGAFLRPDLSWLAVEGDRVVALALGSVNEDDWAGQGYSSVYVDLIGVVRDRRGRRLAPAVITALMRAARDAGLDKVVLDVDTESPTGADSLYAGLGFTPAQRMVALVARS